jgi:sorting nexin-4
VLKLRDQKQLDFEELSDYLSGVTSERDRLAAVISGHAGSAGLGIGAYLKDRVDAIRGADDDRSRVEKMRKLDSKIKEVAAVFRVVVLDTHYSSVASRCSDHGP